MTKTTMKLQYKAWALVFAVLGLCVSLAMLGVLRIVGDSFGQLEADRAHQQGERARRLLDQQLLALGTTARDYAHWDDAVHFLQGKNPSFMNDSFDASNLDYLKISEVLVFDARSALVSSLTLAEGKLLAPVPAQHLAEVQDMASAILSSPEPRRVMHTFRSTDGVLSLVAGTAVVSTSDAGLPPVGAMVMVRRFDEAELQRFSQVLLMPARLSFEVSGHAGEDLHVYTVDDEHADLHVVLRDRKGLPLAELVLGLDRQLEERGKALAWQGMVLSALAGLAASVLLVLLLDRLVLRRLQNLHGELSTVTHDGPMAGGLVNVTGKDELSQLAQGINGLLTRVRTDVDSLKEAHAQQEALQLQLMHAQKTEALGRLTGGIAHDFNNSLAAITGWIRLASEDLDDTHPSHEALQQALKSTRYADGLMRQLLAFGRQSAPKLRRLHWSALIEETRQMVASGLTKDCELSVDYHVDEDEIDADPTQLQQVLVNLLINASDAMKGNGRIDLVLDDLEITESDGPRPPGAAQLPPGRYVVLTVRDHGPGISAEHLDRVFDPFFTTKPKGRGTGLGLSVAQGIMARHQGSVGLINSSQGACFLLYLPASRRDAAVAPITAPGGPGRGRQLLFVDDDQSVRHAWSALLERKGWQVTRSRDGEEAWAQFSQTGKHWDVVLTDQSMPRLDGVGLAQRIHATASPPPVVLMSGHVDEVDAELLRTLFAAVLHKPVDPVELDRVLQGLPMAQDGSVTMY